MILSRISLYYLDEMKAFAASTYNGRRAPYDVAKHIYETLAPIEPGSSILDVSGGPGFVARILTDEYGMQVTVTEYVPDLCEGMRRHLDLTSLKLDLSQPTNDFRSIEDDSFDLVLLRNCLYFAHDIHPLASELKRVLRPGGRILVKLIFPNLATLTKCQFEDYTPAVYWSPKAIGIAMAKVGLKVVSQDINEDMHYLDYIEHHKMLGIATTPRTKLLQWLTKKTYQAYEFRNRNNCVHDSRIQTDFQQVFTLN